MATQGRTIKVQPDLDARQRFVSPARLPDSILASKQGDALGFVSNSKRKRRTGESGQYFLWRTSLPESERDRWYAQSRGYPSPPASPRHGDEIQKEPRWTATNTAITDAHQDVPPAGAKAQHNPTELPRSRSISSSSRKPRVSVKLARQLHEAKLVFPSTPSSVSSTHYTGERISNSALNENHRQPLEVTQPRPRLPGGVSPVHVPSAQVPAPDQKPSASITTTGGDREEWRSWLDLDGWASPPFPSLDNCI